MRLTKFFKFLKKIFFTKSYTASFLALIALAIFVFESLNSQGLFKAFSLQKEQELFAKVIKVSDGDTIYLQDKNGAKYKIRMKGIDAPESKQAYGKEATNYLKNLILNKEVKALIYEKDKYNRFVATIYLPQFQNTLPKSFSLIQTNQNQNETISTAYLDINKQMVRQGYAHAYRSFSAKYIKDEVYARKNKLGLWGQEAHLIQNPADFRKQNRWEAS